MKIKIENTEIYVNDSGMISWMSDWLKYGEFIQKKYFKDIKTGGGMWGGRTILNTKNYKLLAAKEK